MLNHRTYVLRCMFLLRPRGGSNGEREGEGGREGEMETEGVGWEEREGGITRSAVIRRWRELHPRRSRA